jgi:hypothetical protein
MVFVPAGILLSTLFKGGIISLPLLILLIVITGVAAAIIRHE